MTDLLLQSPNIPVEFQDAHYSTFKVEDPIQSAIYRTVSNWRPRPDKPNLLLWGKPGLGKTLMAAASLNERQKLWEFKTRTGHDLPPESVRVLRQHKMPVYFIQLAELIDLHIKSFNMRDRMDKGLIDGEEYNDLVNLLEGLSDRAKWLVVDDVGKEHATTSQFSIDTFDLLVRTRYNNGLYTIFTSNMPISRWERCYSDSMRSFIERTSKIVKFE